MTVALPETPDHLRRRVLIVEDSPTQAAEIGFILEDAGYEVEHARNGNRGLEMTLAKTFDLVLTDIMMPGMSGYDLCRAIKARHSSLPVILLTSLSDPMDIIHGLECGADNFLVKPCPTDHLIHRVRTLIDNRTIRGDKRSSFGIEVLFFGRKFTINSEKEQILDLLISTFEDTVRANRDLQTAQSQLAAAQAKLEQRVEVTEQKYSLLMAHANDAMLILDSGGTVVEANEAALTILGRSRDEILARPFPSFLATEEGDENPELTDFIAKPSFLLRSLRIDRPAGKVYADVSGSRVQLGESQVILVIAHDVTERNQLEQQVRHAQKMEAVGRLTGGIAHDFNNLLGVIVGNLELLSEEIPDRPEVLELAQAALDSALHGAELTQRLLAFARKQPMHPRVVDLNGTVGKLIPTLGRMLGPTIALQAVTADDLGTTFIDGSLVEDAILNLAINARDAMPKGGHLIIETMNVELGSEYSRTDDEIVPGPYVMLAVTDTGTGMPPEVVERAFEPFFTTKEAGKGTGLGLSMIYGFAKQSGGTVAIYSEQGKGTTIKLYLPRSDQTVETAESATMLALAAGDETVLVVEDNLQMRTVAVQQIRSLGYNVVMAETPQDALDLLAGDTAVDLLFTDMIMPGIDGRELARRGRAVRPDLKVLFTSGFTGTATTIISGQGLEHPLITKPYRKADLAKQLRNVLSPRSHDA